ncbi:FAD-binding oxidoreductase [Streptomyces scopuliridis]|uniref:FAD-binding oxidoreductase n=1 Tax=Streptomyces scopuliridis TaxID=452529 RepID=A0ACD4ZC04_9ACTN|nr:FAD-dependent oxidoreductase [Streptomyces scopuliridis]WSB95640.1 FAD-binding oxidoreductase [Streptomyces scopuliridis]WSC10651.1 FAD-binding oxidoreductase [Streptomyces scopuliridis]
MSETHDIVIIGNGILGYATALELVRTDPDLRVAVVGPSDREGSATAAAGAMLNCFGEVTHRTLSSEPGRTKLELSLHALEAWPTWLDELNNDLADDRQLAIREGTYVLLNSCGGQLDSLNYRAITNALSSYGRKYEILPLGDVPNLDPATNARPLEAVHLPQEGSIDARAVLNRVAEVARQRGVTVLDDSVVGWRQADGRAQGIELRSGGILSGGRFLVAAGAFTPAIVEDLKDTTAPLMPIFAGVGVAVTCKATSSGLRHVVRTPNRSGGCGLHLVPGDDTVYIGATNDVLLKPGAWSSLGMAHFLAGGAMEQFDRRLFGSSVTAWHAGNRPLSLDGFPVIGKLWQDNVWVLSGTYRDGFHCAPVLARHTADLLRGGTGVLGHDLFTPLRAPLRTMSREQAVDDMVLHCVSQFYQYSPRLAPWMRVTDGIEVQVRTRTEATYRELGSDTGLAPELLELLNWGEGRKHVLAAFRQYLDAAA